MRSLKRLILAFALCAFATAVHAAESNISDQFYNAIRRDDASAVQALLRSGASANVKDSRDRTPLMYAAAVGSEAMMRLLIEAGADVNARTSFDATALMWCSNKLSRVKLLVEQGAEVNARSKQGHTPVLLASSHAGALEILKSLLAKGANLKSAVRTPPPQQGPPTGMPPDERFRNPLASAADSNDTALINFILDKGGPEMTAGPGGAMALMSAATFGNSAIVKSLLAAGVNVNGQSPPETERVKNGPLALGSLTALILAASGSDTETVRLLLEAGADVNAKDVRGMTPLMLAVATDHPNQGIIRMLLARGADTQVKSKAGETLLAWALKFKNPPVVAAIRAASPRADVGPVADAAPAAAGSSVIFDALAKSVALLQKSGTTSFREGGCISCHSGNMVTAAVASARRKGVQVDDAAASETVRATRVQYIAAADGMLERSDPPTSEILAYALFALAEAGAEPDITIDAMVHNYAAQQLADGSWGYRGILRPPTRDSINFLAHWFPETKPGRGMTNCWMLCLPGPSRSRVRKLQRRATTSVDTPTVC